MKFSALRSDWEEYLEAQVAHVPRLPDVEQVSSRVVRLLGANPGLMQLQGTNTYLVGTGRRRILIDTGEGREEWIDRLLQYLEKYDLELSHILITHWHGDHTGGLPDLLQHLPDVADRVYKCQPDIGQQSIEDGSIFETEGATIRAVFTPGHAFDHMCFVLEEENAMFTGDNVLGHGYTVVEDLGVYLKTLERMKDEDCARGYPGHGSVIENMGRKMTEYIRHRKIRETQIYSALARSKRPLGEGAMTVRELVTSLHGEVSHGLLENVLEPAITEVLWKMAAEQRVGFRIKKGSRQWFANQMVSVAVA